MNKSHDCKTELLLVLVQSRRVSRIVISVKPLPVRLTTVRTPSKAVLTIIGFVRPIILDCAVDVLSLSLKHASNVSDVTLFITVV